MILSAAGIKGDTVALLVRLPLPLPGEACTAQSFSLRHSVTHCKPRKRPGPKVIVTNTV